MEIDLPEKPIHSVKDFFLHIFTITIGILIALGLEQAVEAYHHKQLAAEARANIVSELRDNKKELDGALANTSKLNEQYQHALDLLGQFMLHKYPHGSWSLSYTTVGLLSTSWTTAQSTGALSYMNYQDVKDFNNAYELQQLIQHQQEQLFQTYELALSNVENTSPEKMSTQELQATRQQIKRMMAGLFVLEQEGVQLSGRYAEVLSKHVSK